MKRRIPFASMVTFVLAALLGASQTNAAAVCTADPFASATEVFSIDSDQVGGVLSVCLAYGDGAGAGFALDFSGTPVADALGNLGLSADEVLDDTAGGSFSLTYVDPFFVSSPFVVSTPFPFGAGLDSFFWAVDGNGGRLETVDVFFEQEDADSFALVELSFFADFNPGDPFLEFFGSIDDLCEDPGDPNCESVFDFSSVGGPFAAAIPNTLGNPDTTVPAPATLGLLGLGLLMIRRRVRKT